MRARVSRRQVQGEGDTPQSTVPWSEIARSPEFGELEALRRRVTLGLLSGFGLAVATFLILCAYARPLMRSSVAGGLTVAYVWLLALTVLAWVLVWAYLRFAQRRLQPLAASIVSRQREQGRDGSDRGEGAQPA